MESAWGEEEAPVEWVDLDAEEIKAAGRRCNGENHFAVPSVKVENCVKEQGYALGLEVHMNRSSSNYQLAAGDGAVMEFFDTYYDYSLWNESGETELSVVVGSDTATGEVHFISVTARTPESNEKAVQMMTAITDLTAGKEGTITAEEIKAAADSAEFLEKPEYNYYIYGYDDNGYSIELSPIHNWDEEEETIL